MVYKGRTVLAFILLSIFASSIVTLTIVNPSMLADKRPDAVTTPGPQGTAGAGMSQQDMKKLSTAFGLIENNYVQKIDSDKLVGGAINGMISALDDPFTSYMDPKEAKQFEETVSSSFEGIGAEVGMEDGKVSIVSPIKGSPAEKAGLKAGDVIVSVNGEKLDGLTLSQAILKIRGPKGTQAKLGILHTGTAEPIDVIVVRDEIPLETVQAEMLPGNIGKIEVSQFSFNTAEHFLKELDSLESQGMKGLVIDLRNNPGGVLQTVVKMIEPFVEKGKTIVQVEDREGKRDPTLSKNPNPPKKYPVAVLVDGGSASASEIMASAFQEAVPGSRVIGETTYGKGTVQVSFDEELGDGSNLKMTVYKWLTPNGNWIHKKGVTPDEKVEEPPYFSAKPFSRKETLKPDTVSEDVKTLQLLLPGLGYPVDRSDGYFSKKTADQVRAYQRDHQLEATGEVDVKLMDKMMEDIITQIRKPDNDLQLQAAVRFLQGK